MSVGNINTALLSSVSSLLANQQELAVVSQNISNANSTGYSRETAAETPIVVGGVGEGVDVAEATRQVNDYLIQASRTQFSQVGTQESLNSYYQRIQTYYGSPDSSSDTIGAGNSITDSLNQFFTSLSTLATDPSQASSQSNAVTQAENLAQNISGLASNLEGTRFLADQDISTGVTYINAQLKDLQLTNISIQNAGSSQSTASLLDQRDQDLQNIAEYLNVSVNYQKNGEVSVSTNSGIDLLTPTSLYQLTYTQAGSAQTFENNSNISPINVYQVQNNGSLSASPVGQLVTGGISGSSNPATQIVNKLGAGKLSGLLQIRDTDVPTLLSQLDNMATNLTNAVNAIQNNGSGFPAPNSLTGTRAITSTTQLSAGGQVLIGITDSNGNPIASGYPNQPNGVAPLTLNLSSIYNGTSYGAPSVQDIVTTINNYYGSPQRDVNLGNVNDIQLGALSDSATTGNNFSFDLNLQNLSAADANVQVTGLSVSGGSTVVSGIPYSSTVTAGSTYDRTGSTNGPITVNLQGAGPWTVSANVQVTDATTGVVSTDTINYQINPAANGLRNSLYNFTNGSFGGNASIVNPTNVQQVAHASIVDANGNPVSAGQGGFLKIAATNPNNGVALSELNSNIAGQVNPSTGNIINGTATAQGFSDYFQLNDLFVRNFDGTSNALNMQVNNNVAQNANLLTTGQLTLAPVSSDPTALPNYTYSLGAGNNTAVNNMLNLENQQISFGAASNLPALNVTLGNYSSEVISYAANQIAASNSNLSEAQSLYTGLSTQSKQSSGVNVDEEMSNMLLFQNAYQASAKVITTMQSLFTALQNAIS